MKGGKKENRQKTCNVNGSENDVPLKICSKELFANDFLGALNSHHTKEAHFVSLHSLPSLMVSLALAFI